LTNKYKKRKGENTMTNKEQELRQERSEAAKKMALIIDTAEEKKRALTDEEKAEFDKLDKRIDAINDYLQKRENVTRVQVEDRILDPIPRIGETVGTRAANIKGFKRREDQLSVPDFFKCLAQKDYGPLKDYRVENRVGAVIGSGVAGGFAIPEMLRVAVIDGLLADQGIFAKIGKEFAEGTDTFQVTTFENCDIDQHGLYGFSDPTFVGEGLTIPEGTPRMVQMTWTLKKMPTETRISLEAVATGKLEAALQLALRNVLRYGLEKYIITGSGISAPVGLINASCGVTQTRAGAGAIAYSDIFNMLGKTKLTNNNLWIASQTIIPQLAQMVDAGSNAVWMPAAWGGAAQPVPTNLMGYPIIFTLGLNPILGNKGDILFCSDLSFYKAVIFQDIIVQSSEAAHWSTGEIGLRVIMMVDMKALPAAPITVGGQSFGWYTMLSA
jgi:HK97 family phage major capsid protein